MIIKGKKNKKDVAIVKKNKIENKEPNKVDETMYLIYMTSQDITARNINDYFIKKGFEEVQLWDELNILQLELKNQNTVEFEPMQPFKDAKDIEFLEQSNVKTIYALTIEESDFKDMQEMFKGLLLELGGFYATDTDDFNPVYSVDNL
ncbi:hypothetical protein [Anaeromicropila herbilytica]|uniref:Uncharacterized protein n=1 Tax=Anaeromicropila herbilytica TaxID=2785025 RepID=A0A7R7IFU5_9FIRM|nr:hypothetical protein [Anaeromicropila herbilytica]BCN32438.1 hypothetical protein bsdtb5_37330 [Anaeromicropila herbilytica]